MKHILTIAILASLLTSCSTYKVPEEMRYKAPSTTSTRTACLSGSEKKDPFFLYDDHTVYIHAIDGKIIVEGEKGWEKKVPILPGERNIKVAYTMGSYTASADLSFTAKPNHTYVVDHTAKRSQFADIWIIDTNDKRPVTDIVRAKIADNTIYISY